MASTKYVELQWKKDTLYVRQYDPLEGKSKGTAKSMGKVERDRGGMGSL